MTWDTLSRCAACGSRCEDCQCILPPWSADLDVACPPDAHTVCDPLGERIADTPDGGDSQASPPFVLPPDTLLVAIAGMFARVLR